jgi:hypothetical protein
MGQVKKKGEEKKDEREKERQNMTEIKVLEIHNARGLVWRLQVISDHWAR